MRRYIAAVLLLFGILQVSGAQASLGPSRDSPYWLLYEKGTALMSQKEYGKALRAFQEALAAAGVFPEAEIAIGDIYRIEGELDLARLHYDRAYNQRNAFTVPGMKYEALYNLAGVYEDQDFLKLMEDTLARIIAEDPHFGDPRNTNLKAQIEANFYSKGLDHVLVLYRFDETFSARAHSKLGWFYYRSGRFSQSVLHYLYAVIYRVSEVTTYLRDKDVDFQFTTLRALTTTIDKDPELRQYAADSGLFKDLYYLAGSTFAVGYPMHAADLWGFVAGVKAAEGYAELSASQVKKPRIEPLLPSVQKRPESP